MMLYHLEWYNMTQEIYKRKTMETILDQQCNTHAFHYIFMDRDIMQKSAFNKNLTIYENQILVVPYYTL